MRCLRIQPLFAFITFAICSLAVSSTHAESSDSHSHWAIISVDSSNDAIADLLSVELAKWDRVSLVERAKIDHVLNELKLSASGLVEGEQALKFGQLAQADAIILISTDSAQVSTDQKHANAPAGRRIRLVETRTSMRFLDVLVPTKNVESDVLQIKGELQNAFEKLLVPVEQRILISVAPIKSSEPGEFLRPLCKSLTPLVEVGLSQQSNFVVLERSDLQRLREESKLSGLALEIVGATRFLEIGVRRRAGGQGLEATCHLVTPNKDASDFDVSTNSMAVLELRNAIVGRIANKTPNNNVSDRAKVSPKEEALIFDRRREWLRAAYRHSDEVEMAEAALSLEPSFERISWAEGAYSSCLHDFENKSQRHPEADAIQKRLNELLLQRAELIAAIQDGREFLAKLGSYTSVLEQVPDAQRIRMELLKRANSEWDARLAIVADNPREHHLLLLQRLHVLESISSSKTDYFEKLPAAFEQVVAGMKEFVPQKLTDERAQQYAMQLSWVLRRYYATQERLGNSLPDTPDFQKRLSEDDSECVRFADLYGQVAFRDERGTRAAMRLLMLILDSGVDIPKSNLLNGMYHELPPRILRSEFEEEYFEEVLKRAEQSQNPQALLAQSQFVFAVILTSADDRAKSYATSVLDVLTYAGENNPPARELRNRIVEHLQQRRLMEKLPELNESTDLWGSYRAKPIKLMNVDPMDAVPTCVNVIELNDSNQSTEVIFAWNRPYDHVLVQRMDLSDGKLETITPVFKFPAKDTFASTQLQVVSSPASYFVKSEDKGFAVVHKDSRIVEIFTEEQGAPSNDVLCMAWHKDRMYIAYRDAFASFDPKTKSFELLASSVSVAPRNLLDGRGSFFIMSMVADEPNDCLWMNIQDNSLPFSRNGLWRFEPGKNEYRKVSRFQSSWAHTKEGLVLKEHQREQAYWEQTKDGMVLIEPKPTPWLLASKNGMLNRFGDYNDAGLSAFIFVGSDIIQQSLRLTPDGKLHRANVDTSRWNLFQKCGAGFITHYEPGTKSLWYVERK